MKNQERAKYKSDTLRIIGLGMLTPIGSFFMAPLNFFYDKSFLEIVLNSIILSLGVFVGLKMLARGLKMLGD